MSREKQILTLSNTLPMQVRWGRFSSRDLHLLIKEAQRSETGKRLRDFLDNLLQTARLREFCGREDVLFGDVFKTFILAPALKEGVVRPAKSGPSFVVPSGVTDDSIRFELRRIGDSDVFRSPAGWLLYFKGEVENEARGEESDLDKVGEFLWYAEGEHEDGSREVFAILVGWIPHRQSWGVHASWLGDGRWYVGHRAFPAATDSQTT